MAALETTLRAVNRRAVGHAITTLPELQAIAREVEARLASGDAPQRARVGTVVVHVPAGPPDRRSRRSIKAMSTEVTLVRRQRGWYLRACRRTVVYGGTPERWSCTVSREAADRMVRCALRHVTVGDATGPAGDEYNRGRAAAA